MNPKYKENTAANCVRIPTPKVYHRSKDVQCYRISLLITLTILIISLLANLAFLLPSVDFSKKEGETDSKSIIEKSEVRKEITL